MASVGIHEFMILSMGTFHRSLTLARGSLTYECADIIKQLLVSKLLEVLKCWHCDKNKD